MSTRTRIHTLRAVGTMVTMAQAHAFLVAGDLNSAISAANDHLGAQFAISSLYNSVGGTHKQRGVIVTKGINYGLSLTLVMEVVFALVGSSVFGTDTRDDILLNFKADSTLAIGLKVLMATVVTCCYPLVDHCSRDAAVSLITSRTHDLGRLELGCTIVIYILSVTIAAVVPSISTVLGNCGIVLFDLFVIREGADAGESTHHLLSDTHENTEGEDVFAATVSVLAGADRYGMVKDAIDSVEDSISHLHRGSVSERQRGDSVFARRRASVSERDHSGRRGSRARCMSASLTQPDVTGLEKTRQKHMADFLDENSDEDTHGSEAPLVDEPRRLGRRNILADIAMYSGGTGRRNILAEIARETGSRVMGRERAHSLATVRGPFDSMLSGEATAVNQIDVESSDYGAIEDSEAEAKAEAEAERMRELALEHEREALEKNYEIRWHWSFTGFVLTVTGILNTIMSVMGVITGDA
ncbi:hypothetical protein KIPB_001293 [Kipferlia bialata]|uniref:Amino acid transporter transmembrane domain-containing protein n=1 Tax=Kipferlia bialata TaxID=797122 RepID=A0A9K3GF32_9EUKA|nr:hypothetical protein KIPB_001293 [Kipferlia bialata]|eukprot:g1293.t1